MAFWTQDKTGKPKPVNLTFGPLIDRPLWTQWDKAFVEPDGDEHYPATFLWASNFNSTVSFDTVAAQVRQPVQQHRTNPPRPHDLGYAAYP